jgi:regulator of cell morphogenesis and NO signaling
MSIDSTMTVGEIAIGMPQATRVFEKLKIDYCCGGDQPLTEACANAGVDVKTLLQRLEECGQVAAETSAPLDFQNASLTELITYILDKHHVYTKQEMIRLEELMLKVIGAHGTNHPELKGIGDLFRRACSDLTPHMFKEEQVLFPHIVAMERARTHKTPAPLALFGSVKNPVRMMMAEHDTVGEILREVRGLSSDYEVPADGCISYRTLYGALEEFERDLHQHIHLENNVLFPKAIAMEES